MNRNRWSSGKARGLQMKIANWWLTYKNTDMEAGGLSPRMLVR